MQLIEAAGVEATPDTIDASAPTLAPGQRPTVAVSRLSPPCPKVHPKPNL